MKNKLLLPASFKLPGLVLLLLSLVLFYAYTYCEFRFKFLDTGKEELDFFKAISMGDQNLTNECAYLGMLAGLIAIAFARVQHEDERITFIRLQSLQISHYLCYFSFALSILLINGINFLMPIILMPYLFLVIFILVFYCRLYLLPKFATHEKQS